MPATRIPNMTEEMVALSRDARAYAMNGQGPDNVNLSVHLENNKAGISLITKSLKGESRVIHFSYNKSENSDGTVSLTDGSTASIVVRNESTEVARFNLTFVEEARLLSQSQVKELNSGDFSGDDGSNWHSLSYRTPKNLEEDTNYEFLTELNFDYDQGVAKDLNYGVPEYYYPFPLAWTSSTYGFLMEVRRTEIT